MNRTQLDTLKYEIFNVMPDTINTKGGAASHAFQMSNISQDIPHPRSFEDILADEEELLCLLKEPASSCL